jgi:hypothetical protein
VAAELWPSPAVVVAAPSAQKRVERLWLWLSQEQP